MHGRVALLWNESLVRPNVLHDCIPYKLHLRHRSCGPTDQRLGALSALGTQTEMPKRTTRGVDLSFHADVDGQAGANAALCQPGMASDNLRHRIEHRMSQSELDLLFVLHVITSSVSVFGANEFIYSPRSPSVRRLSPSGVGGGGAGIQWVVLRG
jgi:hypothetical protein